MNATIAPQDRSLRIWTLILAAGASTRMGYPKALLPFDKMTFIERILATNRVSPISHCVVAISVCDVKIVELINLTDTTLCYNATDRNNGAIDSIRSAIPILINHSVDYVLIWPVDHPSVRPLAIASLIDAAVGRAAAIAVPMFNGRRGHPVIFSKEVFPYLESAAANQGARAVFKYLEEGLIEVPVDDPGILADIDTKDEYESLVRDI